MVSSMPPNDQEVAIKKKSSGAKKLSREERLAEQLRANLRRRKTATRSNTDASHDTSNEEN